MKVLAITATLAAALLISSTMAVGVSVASDSGQQELRMAQKQVTFYTTYGYQSDGRWNIPLRLWVSERPGKVRRLAARGSRSIVRKIAKLDELTEQQKIWFKQRSEDFFADSKSRQRVRFMFDRDPLHEWFGIDRSFGSDRDSTDRNGLIEGVLSLSDARVQQLLDAQQSESGWLSIRAVSGDHSGTGLIRMIDGQGVSVISDVDDTIKITGIPDGEATVMRNTFFAPFHATPCMAATYQSFGPEVAFHYVSGGPWQLYRPLQAWLSEVPFPAGSFHMKNVRTNPFESESYDDFRKLAHGSDSATEAQKILQIETLLTHFPERQFILIGDSGELDPEIFQRIRDEHPAQVKEIRVRDVTGAQQHAPDRLHDVVVIPPSTKC
jgi:hypothetical protein